jgi:hypothetical protein
VRAVPVRTVAVRVVVLLAAVLVGSLAGCGRAVDVSVDPASTHPAPGVATRADPGSGGVTGGAADPVDRLRASLLGPGDLGPGWTRGEPPVPDPSTPAPCGGSGTVARFPDALRVGSTVDGPAGLVVQEALSVYGDVDTAQAAFRTGVAGLTCTRGTLHGASVTIAPAGDLRDLGGDRASGWRVGSDALDATLVMVQARQAVFAFAYVTPSGAAPASRPDAAALSRAAVARALAA